MKSVEAFVHIMKSGSLTRAEQSSGMSKASLSRHLAQLEASLGAELIQRGSRHLRPTEAGRAFFARCEPMLVELTQRLDDARTEVQDLSAGRTGTLRVLADPQFGTAFVCQVVRLYMASYPGVHCRMDIAGMPGSLSPEEADCYVCAAPPDSQQLVLKSIGQLGFGLYASPSYLARAGAPDTPDALAEHDAIVLHDALGRGDLTLLRGRAHALIRPRAAFSTNDHWVMKTLCLDGLGIALMPDYFVQPELRHQGLVPVLPEWKPAPRRIHCAFRRQRYAGSKLRDFVDLMARCVVDIDSFNLYVGGARPA
nr:LysR family transcriptional regulator [Variovorax dokdonensis]